MSFITRCPACSTAFKVVPDQLKISDGWVRCGHCQHIFDATLDLQPWWPGQQEPVAPTPTAPPPAPASEPPPSPPSPPVPAPDIGTDTTEPAFEPTEVLEPPPSAWAADPPEPVPEPDPVPDPAVAADPPWTPPAQPSFVRQAERRAFWRKPWVRGVLALGVLALAAALLLQAGVHWRDTVAVRVPAAKPALEAVCAPLDCAVEPPRQLDHIVIDSSVLLRRSPGRYSFNVVIRNTSDVEVTAPALELTLTDINDQVLVRRVLLPAEWPKPIATMGPGMEWAVPFDLALEDLSDQVMTGYRAILFYP